MAAFQYPSTYSFPPFFTLQPVDATRAKQCEQWKQFITSWHQFHRQTTMSVMEWPYWENKDIARKLSDEGIRAVMDYLVSTEGGEWEDASKARCKIFYKSPSDWAAKIHDWVVSHAMTSPGNIYTIYELHSGGICDGSDFSDLDPFLILRALEVLEKNGLCELFRGTSIDETGVKFKER